MRVMFFLSFPLLLLFISNVKCDSERFYKISETTRGDVYTRGVHRVPFFRGNSARKGKINFQRINSLTLHSKLKELKRDIEKYLEQLDSVDDKDFCFSCKDLGFAQDYKEKTQLVLSELMASVDVMQNNMKRLEYLESEIERRSGTRLNDKTRFRAGQKRGINFLSEESSGEMGSNVVNFGNGERDTRDVERIKRRKNIGWRRQIYNEGNKKPRVVKKQYASRSFFSGIVGPGGVKGHSKVSKLWSSMGPNGKKAGRFLEREAELRPDGVLEFEVKKTELKPSGEKITYEKSGVARSLKDIDRIVVD